MEQSSKMKGYIPVIVIVLLVLIAFFAMDKVLYILGLVSPLLGAVILAYVLDVPVRFFENRCRFRRGYAVMTVILIFVLLVALLCYWAVPFLMGTIRDLYDSLARIFNQGDMLMNWVQELSEYLHIDIESFAREHLLKFDQSAKELISSVFQRVYTFLVGTVTNIGSSLLSVVTVVMIAIYMLLEKEDLLNRMRRLVRAVAEKKAERIFHIFTLANEIFKKFIVGKIINSTIVGLIITLLFMVFRVPSAVIFGIITGVFDLIPYFGPIIGSVPVVGLLLIISPLHALIALAIIIIVNQVDGNFIGPKILGKNIGASAFWVITAVAIGGTTFGFFGMIFSVPVVVLAKTLAEEYVDAKLQPEEAAPLEKAAQPEEEAEQDG